MTFAVVEHPDARAEYLDAVEYYDEQREGLGDELVRRFEGAIRDIVDDPMAWPDVPAWRPPPRLRSRQVEVFRYRVVYDVKGDVIRILAYAHTSRRPGYWSHRVSP